MSDAEPIDKYEWKVVCVSAVSDLASTLNKPKEHSLTGWELIQIIPAQMFENTSSIGLLFRKKR